MQDNLLIGRTSRITQELQYRDITNPATGQTTRQASISFNFAVPREYQGANGTVTDFIHCRATGPVAERFNQYCNGKKADGSLMSRHLALKGRFEVYTSTRNVTSQVNINGQLYDVTSQINQTNYIYNVQSITFLDPSSNSGNANAGNANASQATPAQAQPVAVQAQASAPASAPMPAPVEQAPWN